MSLQQPVQPRSSSANGFGRRRVEKDNSSSRMENRSQTGKSNPSRVISAGITSSGKGGGYESPSKDRLMYLTTCLVGYHVDVHVKNGSVFSGIFHASDLDQGFGVVLKMARLTKDISSGGQKAASGSELVSKPPSKTLIIAAHEVAQVVAKDVALTSDGLSNELRSLKQRDLMLDSNISQSRHVEAERELERWMPDEDDPQRPELENIFDSQWTGSWDQFKVNETLFGVKSTFNEELYTTKLERGPRTRELEEEAMRIAREIEGEETHDLHLAEERGANPHGSFDIDEETKYSSVYRGVDDSGYEDEDTMLNSRDSETFGDSATPPFGRLFADVTSGKSVKSFEGGRVSSGSLSKDGIQSTKINSNHELHSSGSMTSQHIPMGVRGFEDDNRVQESQNDEQGGIAVIQETLGTQSLNEEVQTAKTDDLQSLLDGKRDGSEKAGTSSVAATYSNITTKGEEKASSGEPLEDRSGKAHGALEPAYSRERPGSSASSTSDGGAATLAASASAPALSPSSSMGSLSSEKSTLNPNAKEFKLNPNAKSFVPSQSPLRPPSPVSDGSFYFPTNMPTVSHLHGMPVGMGVGPSFVGPQPVLFNPQAAAMQSPGAYYPTNVPQYGQQMFLGHPRQVMYMPGYPPEMPYKGREF